MVRRDTTLGFDVLGPLRVTHGARDITPTRPAHRRLLSILLVGPDLPLHRDVLIDRMWGDRPPATAVNTLQAHVSGLRRLLGADALITDAGGYRIATRPRSIDVDRFADLLTVGRARGKAGDWNAALAAVDDALTLWRGEPYPELAGDPFASPEIQRLAELHSRARELRVESLLTLERFEEASVELEDVVAAEPTREPMWAHLMLARHRLGQRDAALKAYRRARQALGELGVEPGGDLRELERRIRADEPVSRETMGPTRVPPARRIGQTPSRGRVPRSGLVGRDVEMGRLRRVLDARGPSAVVVSGAAGVGKSRLLAEVANLAEAAGWSVERLYAAPAVRHIPMAAVAHLLPDDPGGEPTELLRLVRAGLRRRAGRSPLLLALDDGHDLDDASAGLVHQLVTHEEARAVIVTRPERTRSSALTVIWKEEGVDRIDLEPLGRADTDMLVGQFLDGPVAPDLLDAVWSRSRGHPLYVTVALEEAADRGLVGRHDGQWQLEGELVSARLEELVLSRFHDLDDDTRHAFEALAMAEPLADELMVALAGHHPLNRLRDRDLVVTYALGGEVRVQTAHPLYAEVVSARLSQARRRELAGNLVDALLAMPDLVDRERLRAATWVLEADRPLDAELGVGAAAEALRRGDYPLAERLARGVLAHHPDEAGARLHLGRALGFQGRGDEAEELLRTTHPQSSAQAAAVALARGHTLAFILRRPDQAAAILGQAAASLDDELRWQLDAERALYSAIAGDFTATFEAATAALANPGTPEPARVTAHVNLALAQAMTGRLDELDDTAEAGLRLASRHAVELPLAVEQIDLARSAAWFAAGRLTDLERLLAEHLEKGDEDAPRSPMLLSWRGLALSLRGQLTDAITVQDRALALYELTDPFRVKAQAQGILALYRAQGGDTAPGLDRLLDSASADAGMETRLTVWIGRGRAWTTAARGDLEAAGRLAAETGVDAIDHDHVVWGAWALHDAVRIGRPDLVRGDLERAVALTSGASLLEAMRDHAVALDAADPAALDAVARRFAGFGCQLYAAEASGQAARQYAEADEQAGSRRAATRTQLWLHGCSGVATPAVDDLPEGLSRREVEVAALAAAGHSSRDVAARLYLTVPTVGNYLRSIYRKLELDGQEELVAALAPAVPVQ